MIGPFKDEKIRGLLCCAFEGGSNYWYHDLDYQLPEGARLPDPDDPDYWHWSQIVPLLPGGHLTMLDGEDETQRLDRDALERGIKVLFEKYPRHFADAMRDHTMDAITGDVFLQCCLFGEVVYG